MEHLVLENVLKSRRVWRFELRPSQIDGVNEVWLCCTSVHLKPRFFSRSQQTCWDASGPEEGRPASDVPESLSQTAWMFLSSSFLLCCIISNGINSDASINLETERTVAFSEEHAEHQHWPDSHVATTILKTRPTGLNYVDRIHFYATLHFTKVRTKEATLKAG